MNEEMKDTVAAAALDKDATFEDAEEGKLDGGLRHRSPPVPFASKLSLTSRKYDVDGDGKLDEAEQTMRDMDTDNRGYLSNEEVYKVMVKQMKLQQEVFSLKRLSLIFLVIMVFLSLATLGTSFAAAVLSKDTDVKNGVLVVKDGGDTVATSTAARTFIVSGGATPSNGRRTQDSGVYTITRGDANTAWIACPTTNIRLQRECEVSNGVQKIVEIPFCPGSGQTQVTSLTNILYTYTVLGGGSSAVVFDCPIDGSDCTVTFPYTEAYCGADTVSGPGTDTDLVIATPLVILGTASNYAILSKTGITTVPTSVITGDIAVSPIAAAAMTGFSFTFDESGTSSTQIIGDGKAFASDYLSPVPALLSTAVSNMETAYTDAAGRVNTNAARINLGSGLLGGDFGGPTTPLTPGIYTFSTNVEIVTNIYFKGTENDIFIIQIAQKLTQAANINVFLQTTDLGKPKMENIFWQVAGAVSIGAGAHMEGILLAKTSVTFITGSSLNGRVLTQTMCALQVATINAPTRGVGGTAVAVVRR